MRKRVAMLVSATVVTVAMTTGVGNLVGTTSASAPTKDLIATAQNQAAALRTERPTRATARRSALTPLPKPGATVTVPTFADPVAGIPNPCPVRAPFPDDAPMADVKARMASTFHITLAGDQWIEKNRPVIKTVWQTLDAMSCTDYFDVVLRKSSGKVGLNAQRKYSFAVGDWGLTKTDYVTLDFDKLTAIYKSGDVGRISRLVSHEFGHTYNRDRGANPEYWQEFQKLWRSEGQFSDYAGSSVTETFADVIGYYVGRCARNNPYDTDRYDPYYRWVRDNIFGGREFGPAPGTRPSCATPSADVVAERRAVIDEAIAHNRAVEDAQYAAATQKVSQLKAAQPRSDAAPR